MRLLGTLSKRVTLITMGVTVLAVALCPSYSASASSSLGFGLPTPQCQPGDTPLLATAAAVTPHGGHVYTFSVDGGEATSVVPPAGFNPLTADASTLQEMNFTPRPTDSAGLARWISEMRAYKRTDLPAYCEASATTSRSPQLSAISTAASLAGEPIDAHLHNENWSGYLYNYSNTTAAIAHWTQNGAAACGCTNPLESSWVGIGGKNGGLAQAGTDDTPGQTH